MKRERETGSSFVVSPGAMGEATENQVKTGSSSDTKLGAVIAKLGRRRELQGSAHKSCERVVVK
jgi:hypothetical protein